MAWISMPRRLTSMWPDVEFFKLNREPADVDRVSVAREVAEDRGPFCGCGDGRRAARGGSGAERVRERLAELGRQDPSIEMQFSMPDQWSRHLFLALCRRYGMRPYRYYRHAANTGLGRA